MKKLLRSFVINFAAIDIASYLNPGMSYSGGIQTLAIATIILGIINLAIRPIIDLLLLPINLITVGSFRWLINVIVLFLLSVVISGLTIGSFSFLGFEYRGFIIPAIEVSTFISLVLSSAVVSLTIMFLNWLIKEK